MNYSKLTEEIIKQALEDMEPIQSPSVMELLSMAMSRDDISMVEWMKVYQLNTDEERLDHLKKILTDERRR